MAQSSCNKWHKAEKKLFLLCLEVGKSPQHGILVGPWTLNGRSEEGWKEGGVWEEGPYRPCRLDTNPLNLHSIIHICLRGAGWWSRSGDENSLTACWKENPKHKDTTTARERKDHLWLTGVWHLQPGGLFTAGTQSIPVARQKKINEIKEVH